MGQTNLRLEAKSTDEFGRKVRSKNASPISAIKVNDFVWGCPIEGNCLILFDACCASPKIDFQLPSSTQNCSSPHDYGVFAHDILDLIQATRPMFRFHFTPFNHGDLQCLLAGHPWIPHD